MVRIGVRLSLPYLSNLRLFQNPRVKILLCIVQRKSAWDVCGKGLLKTNIWGPESIINYTAVCEIDTKHFIPLNLGYLSLKNTLLLRIIEGKRRRGWVDQDEMVR